MIITVILVLIVAFLAGMEGSLDSFEFHQPVIAASLIGIAYGHPVEGIMLGGSLQLISLGWMNIGAALSPDTALMSVAASILMMKSADASGTLTMSVPTAVAIALPIAIAGLALKTLFRILATTFVHIGDRYAEQGDIGKVEMMHYISMFSLGFQSAVPAAFIMALPSDVVTNFIKSLPDWLTSGLQVAAGLVVVVGYAMVISMMATAELWPWFFMGFALASITELNLIQMGMIGLVLALIYLQLSPKFNGGGGNNGGSSSSNNSGDELDAVLNDY